MHYNSEERQGEQKERKRNRRETEGELMGFGTVSPLRGHRIRGDIGESALSERG